MKDSNMKTSFRLIATIVIATLSGTALAQVEPAGRVGQLAQAQPPMQMPANPVGASPMASAMGAEPRIKPLAEALDPIQGAVLIGRVETGAMVFQLEIEGAEAMWMLMGQPPMWAEQAPAADERYHIEFKVTDPASGTRIPYAQVTFSAINHDTAAELSIILPPMWGSSGLHYSQNAALAGDGAYSATVTVDVPTFMREMADKDLWAQPISARFHFRLLNGLITEVTELEY